ncbi:MAG: hypothetical protein KQH53_18145 [Desulfarculaceae bacterium]|nr:hypothetical protein [Desulfarculaceae bacterium]
MSYQILNMLGKAFESIIKDEASDLEVRKKAIRLLGEHLDDARVLETIFYIAAPISEQYPDELKAEAIRTLESAISDDIDIVSMLKEKMKSDERAVRIAAAELLSKHLDQDEWERIFGMYLLDARETNVWAKDKDCLLDIMGLRWEEKHRREKLEEILADLKKHLPE